VISRTTDKPCKRCKGKGYGQWGTRDNTCWRCGGHGFERMVDIPASLAWFETRLVEIKQKGEAAKAAVDSGEGDKLVQWRHRNDLESARRDYKATLQMQDSFRKEHKVLA
jgi:DnaJ-class molecular chaperone